MCCCLPFINIHKQTQANKHTYTTSMLVFNINFQLKRVKLITKFKSFHYSQAYYPFLTPSHPILLIFIILRALLITFGNLCVNLYLFGLF